MKKRLSLMAVGVLSCMGWNAAAAPIDGSLVVDSGGHQTELTRIKVTCTTCVAGVRG